MTRNECGTNDGLFTLKTVVTKQTRRAQTDGTQTGKRPLPRLKPYGTAGANLRDEHSSGVISAEASS